MPELVTIMRALKEASHHDDWPTLAASIWLTLQCWEAMNDERE